MYYCIEDDASLTSVMTNCVFKCKLEIRPTKVVLRAVLMPVAIDASASVRLSVFETSISLKAENNIIRNPHTVPINPSETIASLLNHSKSLFIKIGLYACNITLKELMAHNAKMKKLSLV